MSQKSPALACTIWQLQSVQLKWRKDGRSITNCLDYLISVTVKCRREDYNNEDLKVHHGSDIPNDKHSLISNIRKEPLCKN